MSEEVKGPETPEEQQRRKEEEEAEKFRKQRGLLEKPVIVRHNIREYLSGGKPLTDNQKRHSEESQRRLRNFRLSLIDEDKLGPVE